MIEYTLLIRREATLYYYDDVGCVYGFGIAIKPHHLLRHRRRYYLPLIVFLFVLVFILVAVQ